MKCHRVLPYFIFLFSSTVFSNSREIDYTEKRLDLSDVKTPVYSETLVDDTHDFLTKKVWLISNTVDAFFTDAEVNENKNPGNARIWYEFFSEKGEDKIFRPDFRLKLYLRKTRKLLRINLSNTSIQQENSSRIDQNQVDGATSNRDKKISASVSKDVEVTKIYRFSSSLGARLGWPLNTYIRLKNKINYDFSFARFYGNLDLYYYRESKSGSVFNLNLTGPIFKKSEWRLHQFYNFEELADNTYGLGYQIFTYWNDNNSTSAQIGVNGLYSEGKHFIDQYYISYNWRRNLYKKWLFFELTPNIKAKNNLEWKVYPGIYTKIELFFGDLS